MKIHSLRADCTCRSATLNTGKECGKQDRRRPWGFPQKRQRSQDHRNRSPCPDNRRPLQGNRQGHPLQTNTYGQFHIIIQEQAFCGHISAQSGNRKSIHKISELQRCTVYSFERAVGHGRDCRIYPPEPFLKACPMQGGLQKVYISLTIL